MTEPLDAKQTNLGDCLEEPFPLPSARNPGAIPVVMDRSAWNAIREHGDATPNVEICGVLVGILAKDSDGPYLHIRDVIRGDHAEGQMGQVTFTAETWRHIQLSMDAKPATWRILGWYHTHPGFGIFLSGMDLFIENNFFNLPWQIAYVYDPLANEEGLFAWSQGEPRKVGFLMREDAKIPAATAGSGKPHPLEAPVTMLQQQCQMLRRYVIVAFAVGCLGCLLAMAAFFRAGCVAKSQADVSRDIGIQRSVFPGDSGMMPPVSQGGYPADTVTVPTSVPTGTPDGHARPPASETPVAAPSRPDAPAASPGAGRSKVTPADNPPVKPSRPDVEAPSPKKGNKSPAEPAARNTRSGQEQVSDKEH